MPIITLTTDFGASGYYVAQMKGVILGINPQAAIIDISHSVRPQDIREGSYVIGQAHRYFPAGAIHVVVVDPGVGTSRRPILLSTPGAHYLAPDNGVLSQILLEGWNGSAVAPALEEAGPVSIPPSFTGYHLTNASYWMDPVSRTFHGRDIFSPVAAHLSLGVHPDTLAGKLTHLTYLPTPAPKEDDGSLAGEVVSIDHYGNLITNIPAGMMADRPKARIMINGHTIDGLSDSYESADHLLAIIGSGEHLEIAVKNGNAAEALPATIGDLVRVYHTHS